MKLDSKEGARRKTTNSSTLNVGVQSGQGDNISSHNRKKQKKKEGNVHLLLKRRTDQGGRFTGKKNTRI
jgi:hypothetical protein